MHNHVKIEFGGERDMEWGGGIGLLGSGGERCWNLEGIVEVSE